MDDAFRYDPVKVFAALTLDPLCLRVRDIAELTDWQIEHLYRRPAEERAEFLRSGGEPEPHEPVVEAEEPPSRESYIRGAEAMFGPSRDWGREYDRMMAARTAAGGDHTH